jgi:protein-S-isoprenylcysteine O-methyltransferase Ste14
MVHVLDGLLIATGVLWGAAELGLQLRQVLRSARTERTEWRSLGVIVVTAMVGISAAKAVAHAVPALHYGTQHVAVLLPVLLIAWAGVGLRLWAILTLGRFFRGTVHIQEGHRVVASGPYRIIRHPAYSGILLAVVGFAALYGSLLSWAVQLICVLTGIVYRIHVEERLLLTALGTPYADYAARTRRLLPGVW